MTIMLWCPFCVSNLYKTHILLYVVLSLMDVCCCIFQALDESSGSAVLTARLRLPTGGAAGGVAPPTAGVPHRIVLSPAQFSELHSVIAT